MNRRGSVPLLVGTLMISLVGGVGITLDAGRAWLVEARLQSAVDAAGLAAARRMSEPTRDTEAAQVFWANLTQGGRPANFLGATVSSPVVIPDPTRPDRVRVQASATVPLTLGAIFGSTTVSVSHSATARRSATGLEMAIVIDQSGSMFGAKLAAARAAAGTMLDILYGGPDVELARNLYVSVVPFAGEVNIGTVNSHMLDTSSMPAGWDLSRWNGCVEVRSPGFELTDSAPVAGGRFRPFFWPSTFQQVGSVESGRCTAANAYPAVNGVRHCHGDNDWFDYGTNSLRTHAQLAGNEAYDSMRSATPGPAHDASRGAGPNLLCMQTPILPLTARRSVVQAHLNSIAGRNRSNGTNVQAGLQAAWHTLSPAWRGYWQNTNADVPNVPDLPLNYGTPLMRKAVVLMTDGANNWIFPYPDHGRNDCGSTTNRGVCGSASGVELTYSAYGRVSAASGGWNARFPTQQINPVTIGNAVSRFNARFVATCTAMKDAGIQIYVVGFEVANETNRTRLRNCATNPTTHYFEAPTTADLKAAFNKVASQLAGLSLAE